MGGMISVVVLALIMVPVFFVVVQKVLARDRDEEAAASAEHNGTPNEAARIQNAS